MTEKRGIIHNGDVNLFNNNGAHVRWFILSFVVDYYDNFFLYVLYCQLKVRRYMIYT